MLQFPELIRQIHIVRLWIIEALHFIPHGVEMLCAQISYLIYGRSVVNTFSFFKNLFTQIFSIEVTELFTFPHRIRVEYLIFFSRWCRLFVQLYDVCQHPVGIFVKQSVYALESRICYFTYILTYLDLRDHLPVLLKCRKLVHASENRLRF